MTDRERWQLRGPVSSCRLERKSYFRRCRADTCDTEEREHVTTLDFRPDGSLSRRAHHNPDGSELTFTYEYEGAGRLTQMRAEATDGAVDLSFYEYDNAGRLLRVFARNGDSDRTTETYEYDSAGGKSKTFHADVAAPHTNMHYGVEGTDTLYSAPGAASLTTIYNHRDQPAQLLFHDLAGRELSRVEFRYDRAGNLIEEAYATSEQALPPELLASLNPAQLQTVRGFFGAGGNPIRRTHAYDEQGRRVETRSNKAPHGFDRKTVTYNEQGDPLVEVNERESREVGIDEEGRIADSPAAAKVHRSEAHFRYDYDSHGNWVSKTVGGPGSEQDSGIFRGNAYPHVLRLNATVLPDDTARLWF